MTYSMKTSFLAAVASTTALCGGVEGRKNLHTPYHQKSAALGHWDSSCRRGTDAYERCHIALKAAGLRANAGTAERNGRSRDVVRAEVCASQVCSETCQKSTLCKPRGDTPVSTAIQRLLAAGKNKETRKRQSKLGNRQSTVVKDDALAYFYFDWYVKQNNGDTANLRKAAEAAYGILNDVMYVKQSNGKLMKRPDYPDYWVREMVAPDEDFEDAVAGFDKNLELVVDQAVAEYGSVSPDDKEAVAEYGSVSPDDNKEAADREMIDGFVLERVKRMMKYYPDAKAKVTTELGSLSDMLLDQDEQRELVGRVLRRKKEPCPARSSEMSSYLTPKGIHGFFYMIAKNLKQKADKCDNMACVAELYFNGNRHHWLKLGPVLKCDPKAKNCIESEAEKKNDQLRKAFAFRGNDFQNKGRWTGLEKGFNKANTDRNGFLSAQKFETEEDVLKLQVGADFLKMHEDKLKGQCVEATASGLVQKSKKIFGQKSKKALLRLLSTKGSSQGSSSDRCSQAANEKCRTEPTDERDACCEKQCRGLVSPVWKDATHTLEELAFPKFGAGFGTPESKAGGIGPLDGVEFNVYPEEYYKKFTEEVVPDTEAWVDVWQGGRKVTGVTPTTNKQTYWVEHQWKGTFANTRNPSPWLSNPAEMFRMCNVPWVGGVSGSSIEMIKLVDGYFGKADRFHEGSVLAIAAAYNVFGFHSISEVFAATYAWGYWSEYFPREAADYTIPFDVNTTKGDLLVAAVTGVAWDDRVLQASRDLPDTKEAGYELYHNLVKQLSEKASKGSGERIAKMFDNCPRFGGKNLNSGPNNEREKGQYLGEDFYNLGVADMKKQFAAKMAYLSKQDSRFKFGFRGWSPEQTGVCYKRFRALTDCRSRQHNWYYRMVQASEKIMAKHDNTWEGKRPAAGPSQEEVDEMLKNSQVSAHLKPGQ